jgi:HD-like signal output (HDOD) protein
VERIGDLIGRDPAITAKLLQLANSAAFGLRRKMARPDEAVAYVGLETTKALMLLAHTFSFFDDVRLRGFCVESLRWHSVMAGRFAKRIARLEDGLEEVADHSFAAGLLHDIGKLLFAANLPEQFGRAISLVRERKLSLWEAETEIFGTSHAELGGCLLGIWGLPVSVITAVAFHHHPSQLSANQFNPLTSVHAANILAHQAWSDQPLVSQSDMDLTYLEALGLVSRIQDWERYCLAPCDVEPPSPETVEPACST